MKKRMFELLILIIFYLGFDYQSYYYGLGKGFIAPKIPKEFIVIFAGSDLGNQGIILKENVIGGIYLVAKNRNIYLKQNDEIFIKVFSGYYFNKKNIIVEITDNANTKRYVEINTKRGKPEYTNYFFSEINKENIKNYHYINLNYSLKYFKFLKLIKNIILVAVSIFMFSILKKTLLSRLKSVMFKI